MQDERFRRIVLLLIHKDEHLQPWTDAPTWTGSLVARAAQSGPGPSHLEDCRTCEGIGRVVGNAPCRWCAAGGQAEHRCHECPTCNGARRLHYDGYTRQPVDASEARKVKVGGGRRRSGHVSQRDLGDEAHKILRAEKRRNTTGAFAALERALAGLRDTDEVAHGLVQACYVEERYGDPWRPRIGEAERWAIARGLLYLSQAMPDAIELPMRLEVSELANGRAKRARALVDELGGHRAAARALGISKERLRGLLRRPL